MDKDVSKRLRALEERVRELEEQQSVQPIIQLVPSVPWVPYVVPWVSYWQIPSQSIIVDAPLQTTTITCSTGDDEPVYLTANAPQHAVWPEREWHGNCD